MDEGRTIANNFIDALCLSEAITLLVELDEELARLAAMEPQTQLMQSAFDQGIAARNTLMNLLDDLDTKGEEH